MSKKICLLNRAENDGISIQKVFAILMPFFLRKCQVSEISMKLPGIGLRQVGLNLLTTIGLRRGENIMHITGAIHYLSYVLKRENTITTVHDLKMLSNKKRNRISDLFIKILFLYSLKRNKYIVCISEKTKKELLSLLDFPEDRIFVIPDPISDLYRFTPQKFNKIRPRILHIGTKENKNLIRTVHALKDLKIHLHIVGKLSEEQIEELQYNRISYSNTFNVSEEDLIKEYLLCDIVSFASTYEGFGMPIIEAQAIGRVCLTSSLEPMISVAGAGAEFVDPYDESSIRQGFLKLINDDDYRQSIIDIGVENSKKYRAEVVAESYIEIYNKIEQ